jgi:hypothetical protein
MYAQQDVLFEQSSWEQVLQKAKKENKLVFIDVSGTNCSACEQILATIYTNDDVGKLYNSNFINYRILPQNDKHAFLVSRYNIKSFPAYFYIRPDEALLYSSDHNSTTDDFIANADLAIKERNAEKPIGQWDLEYKVKKPEGKFLYAYIEKRTSLALNNADIIDQYASVVPDGDVLKKNALSLFLKNEQINANGAFFRFILDKQEKVKNILHLNNAQFQQILSNSIDYSFDKACKAKSEALLNDVIEGQLACMKTIGHKESEIIRNEYRTKFYYATKQPVLLSNYVTLYANTIINQKEEIKKQEGEKQRDKKDNRTVNKKALFPLSFTMHMMQKDELEQLDVAYSFKLRDAAQYVVEMLSNKTMLNNALTWSKKAIELFDYFSNYETHAYVLYKLGKRSEAIACMEKAYAVAPSADESGSAKEQVEAKLIKMKRGERIW